MAVPQSSMLRLAAKVTKMTIVRVSLAPAAQARDLEVSAREPRKAELVNNMRKLAVKATKMMGKAVVKSKCVVVGGRLRPSLFRRR